MFKKILLIKKTNSVWNKCHLMSALSILYHIPSWFCLIGLLERYADGLITIGVKLQASI